MSEVKLIQKLQELGYEIIHHSPNEFKVGWNKFFNRPDIIFHYLNVEFGCWIESDGMFWEIEDLDEAFEFFVKILERKGLTKYIEGYILDSSEIVGY